MGRQRKPKATTDSAVEVPSSPDTTATPPPSGVAVRFISTVTVKDGTGTTFEAGKVYTLTPDSAEHWIRRSHATVVDNSPSE